MAPSFAAALQARGYTTLTPVQEAVLGVGEEDLLVSAQTGSGKTVAFGIAVARTILGDEESFEDVAVPLALVVAPTRELALQVERELSWLYGGTRARLATCVGGMDYRTERRTLGRGAHIVVGTPGRLRDHITRGSLDLGAVQAVVLDEADEMLDLGFRDDLEFILAAAPDDRRTLLFSATVPRSIEDLASRFQRDAKRVTVTSDTDQHADIEYRQVIVAAADRENAIINTLLFHDSQSAIVFCHTREAVRHLASRLGDRGFSVVALSGELSQSERTNALQSMRDGRARVCVATDVAARGIDLPKLDLVIHADIPSNPDTLLHRSGRTGRAGRKGVCTLIVPTHRRGAATRVLRMAKLTAEVVAAPTIAQIEERDRERILNDPALSTAPEAGDEPLVRALVDAHSPESLAAAYVRLQSATRPSPEELIEVDLHPKRERRERPGEAGAGGAGKAPRNHREFEGGVWFRVSIGHRHRADPRWLLPLICKSGGVKGRDVGSIRIYDTETQFQITRDRADVFAATVEKNGTGEAGITIRRVPKGQEGAPPRRPTRRPSSGPGGRPPKRGRTGDRPNKSSKRRFDKPYKPHGKG